MKIYTLAPLALAVSCSMSLLTGCSSSSDGVSDASISGAIVAAPVAGAQVSVTDANGNPVVGPVTTGSAGQYTLTIPAGSLGQALILTSTGGTFTDEATGNNGTAGDMFAYMSANSISNGSRVSATPASTIVADLVMNHAQSLADAQTNFARAFGYTPDISITPVDATVDPAGASDASKLAGLRAAAFSQLAMNLGLTQNDQFDMFAALAKDLSNGLLDGVDASGAVNIGATGPALKADIQNSFATAMIAFHKNTGRNQTGLNNAQIGTVPFAKTALTTSYKIEYVEGTMKAMEGKTMFSLRITDHMDVNQPGLSPTIMPMMYMAAMSHSAPKTVVTYNATTKLYTATIYYLMPSQMMNGSSMGYWDLKVDVDGDMNTTADIVHFYPTVMMAMGDTAKTRLKGQSSDMIKDMNGNDVKRDYFIFKDSLTGMGPYTFTMFIAAKETMMSFPAVVNGNTLASGMMGTPLVISSIAVNVSVNGGGSVSATDNLNGTWTIADLALNSGVENEIQIKLTVNGEIKTSDGTAEGVNAAFTITPGMSM
jgi:hypothetical protein